ncbi:MAG: hypothetical protein R3C27_08060 [Hyphomonadaceae bacterium]
MSYRLKLGVALAVAALALPTLAAAQDPSTRTDLTIVGAINSDSVEQVADTSATPAPDAPVVYEDDDAPNVAEEASASSQAD